MTLIISGFYDMHCETASKNKRVLYSKDDFYDSLGLIKVTSGLFKIFEIYGRNFSANDCRVCYSKSVTMYISPRDKAYLSRMTPCF